MEISIRDSVIIVKHVHVIIQHPTDNCQFQIYDINKLSSVGKSHLKCDDLASGSKEII